MLCATPTCLTFRHHLPDFIKCVLGMALMYTGFEIHAGAFVWGNCFWAALCWICSVEYWICLVAQNTCKEISKWVHLTSTWLLAILLLQGVVYGASLGYMALWLAAGSLSLWRYRRSYDAAEWT